MYGQHHEWATLGFIRALASSTTICRCLIDKRWLYTLLTMISGPAAAVASIDDEDNDGAVVASGVPCCSLPERVTICWLVTFDKGGSCAHQLACLCVYSVCFLSISVNFSALALLIGRQEGRWFVGGDDLTGVLQLTALQLQFVTTTPSPLAPIKSRMETFWYWLTQVHLEKWPLKQRQICKQDNPKSCGRT